MSTEQNKELVRRFYEEVWNVGNIAKLEEFVAADFVERSPMGPELAPGLEGVKQFFTMMLSAFSDMHGTPEDMIAEGDKVVTRYTATFTHSGEFMGIPATGKRITITGIEIFRIAGGKMVERWESFDQLGMMQQLGVIPQG
jgi:steroid delta-isomerase-like uncharacterized protein